MKIVHTTVCSMTAMIYPLICPLFFRYRLGTRNATLPVDDVVQDINGEPVTNTALELPPEVREVRLSAVYFSFLLFV